MILVHGVRFGSNFIYSKKYLDLSVLKSCLRHMMIAFEKTSPQSQNQITGLEYRDRSLLLVLEILKEMRGRNTLRMILEDFFQ